MKDLKDLGFIEESNQDLSDLGFSPEENAPAEQEAPGYLETIARQVPQGITVGLSDEIRGAIASPSGAYKTLSNLVGAKYPESETEEYKKARDEERAALAATQEANPVTATVSQLIGGLLPGGAIAKGVGMLAKAPLTGVQTAMRAGALEGTLYGAGQSDEETASELAKDALTGTAVGGVLGAGVGQLGKFLGGNASDIARGALPAGTKPSMGAIRGFSESKLGERIKGFYQAGKEDIDLSSKAAELARGERVKEEAAKIIDASSARTKEVGKQIGERVKQAGPLKPPSIEQVLSELPQEVQQEVISVLPGKIKTISEAPPVLQKELETTEKTIQDIIRANPEEATKNFQKVSSDMMDPAMLDGELQYSQLGQVQAERVRKALQDNPQQTLTDLYNNIVKGELPSPELDDLFQQMKYKAVVQKLAKEAQVSTGQVPEDIQALQNLLNKKAALKKAVSQFGKTTVKEPDQTVTEVVTKLDDSRILESDKVPARKLKDIITKYIQKDGTVLPEKTAEFRDSLQFFQNSTDSFEIRNLAKKLETDVADFRRQAAGELSSQFHDLKSFADMLKVDISGLSENEIKNQLAARFGKYIAKSEGAPNLDTGMSKQLIDRFVEANGNDPIIAESLRKIAKEVQWSELHAVKSGSKGSMFDDGVNRIVFAFPLETAGQVSSNAAVKAVTSTASSASNKLLNLPAAGWRAIAAKTSTVSPTLSRMASTMADTTDEGKRRAILNSLNQMPAFRKSIEDMYGNSEEQE